MIRGYVNVLKAARFRTTISSKGIRPPFAKILPDTSILSISVTTLASQTNVLKTSILLYSIYQPLSMYASCENLPAKKAIRQKTEFPVGMKYFTCTRDPITQIMNDVAPFCAMHLS